MPRFLIFFAILACVGLVAGVVVVKGIPELVGWHIFHCVGEHEPLCNLATPLLQYWGVVVVPLVLGVSYLAYRAVVRRAAA